MTQKTVVEQYGCSREEELRLSLCCRSGTQIAQVGKRLMETDDLLK